MVINLFFFIYSIIIIFGKGEGGRGLIFGGDIVCRIWGLTFGGGAYFRRFTVWLYLGPISEKFTLRGRFLQSTVPQNQNFSPSAPTMGGGGGGGPQADTISYCTKNLIHNLVP